MSALDIRAATAPGGRIAARPVGEAARVRWAWWRSGGHRNRLHTRPLLAPAPAGRLRLPGVRVETVLVEAADAYRRPAALVLVPETGHVSTTLDVAGDAGPAGDAGDAGDDPAWTDELGAWLALLAQDPHLAGCAVILRRRRGRPAPAGGPGRRRALIQLTWLVEALRDGDDAAAAAVEVLARVPRLVQSLRHGAVGTARPMPASELAVVVREAYRPTASGDAPTGRAPWGEAGPLGPVESWHEYRHSGAVSLTWSLSQVPPSAVLSTLAPSLTAVPEGYAGTRVTLRYRPGDKGGPPRLDSLVTVTTTEPDAGGLPVAAQALLDQLPAPLRPWLRPCYGSQAAAFAAGLPTGTLLTAHAAPPGLLHGS